MSHRIYIPVVVPDFVSKRVLVRSGPYWYGTYMTRFAVFSDAELAVLWYGLHYDDGMFYESGAADGPADRRVVAEVDAEVEGRGLGRDDLVGLWQADVS